METGHVSVADLPGGIDLQATLESGQSYLWGRDDGALYETDAPAGGDAWYHVVVDGEAIRVRQRDDHLEWEATTDAEPILTDLLRLDDDLNAIAATAPEDELVRAAYDEFGGLRLVRDPFFPTVIAFICSAQMRVGRIAAMQAALRREFGDPIELGERTYYGFPDPETLAAASEAELRDLGLGYRAPYVRDTAGMVADGELARADVAGLDYEAARDALTGFVGVGDKVADCICLFALDHLEAVPLDTWIRSAIEDHYPDCARGSYADTSRAIRERLGGDYAGYHQTYLFHYLRTGAGS
ncbi:MAG: DNA-3-methyladenine glycosylase [Halobacteriaceae archaeon]